MRQLAAIAVAMWAGAATAGDEGTPQDAPAAAKDANPPAAESAPDFGPGVGRGVTLSGRALQESPGTLGDPFRTLLLLPGVSALVSGAGAPVVRGLQPATTEFFLDGVRIPMPFHLAAGPSVVHPDFIESLSFEPGATPVEHGRFLGGEVDASVPEAGGPRRATASIDLLNVSAFVHQPIESTGTSVTAAARLGYAAYLGALVANAVRGKAAAQLSAGLYDYQALVDQRVGSGHLRLLAFGMGDEGGQRAPNAGDVLAGGLGFHRADLRLRYPVLGGSVEAAATVGVDRANAEVGGGGSTFGLVVDERLLASRASLELPLSETATVALGGDVEQRRATSLLTSAVHLGEPPEPVRTLVRQPIGTELAAGIFARARFRSGDEWIVDPAVRLDTLSVSGGGAQITFEPRLWIQYALDPDTAFSFAGGVYHQPVTTLVPLPGVDVARARLQLQEMLKFEVGAERKLPWWALSVRATGYAYPMARMLELSPLDADFQRQISWDPALVEPELEQRAASGSAYGVELLVRRVAESGVGGWISYAFQRNLRHVQFPRLDAYGEPNGLIATADLPAPLEQEHVLNAVAEYAWPNGWRVAGAVHFNTGVPEAGGIASYTKREGVDAVSGTPRWIPVERDQVARMPWFWRLDARASKTWTFSRFALELYLDVLNVAFSQETLRYNYNEVAASQADRLAGRITLQKSALKLPVLVPLLGLKAAL